MPSGKLYIYVSKMIIVISAYNFKVKCHHHSVSTLQLGKVGKVKSEKLAIGSESDLLLLKSSTAQNSVSKDDYVCSFVFQCREKK